MRRSSRFLAFVALSAAVALLTGCDGSGEAAEPTASTPSPPVIAEVSPTAGGVEPAEPVEPPDPPSKPPESKGRETRDCVNGWLSPPEGGVLFDEALEILRRETHWPGRFVVFDMRYFEGPESPPDPEKGYLRVVRRWYVKGYARRDPALQGRFLIESRVFGSGVSAVAPFESKGWRSPDWIGFQLDTANPEPRAYPGLPGEWPGTPYDFVEGGEGLTIPGIPDEAVGCLEGT